MIKKLRIKFIVVSTLSVLLVLTIIMSTVNILNYHQILNDADNILHILSENNGKFPRNPPEKPSEDSENTPKPPMPKEQHEKLSPEMPYETRYFSVLLDGEGNILSTDTGKIAAIDEADAESCARQVYDSGRETGFLSSYRYLKCNTNDGWRIIFLDCGRNLTTFRTFLLTSILVSLLGLVSVLILVVFFSQLVMKPVSESYEKQRRFITDAGHEIKTPLTIIDANTEIMEMEFGENEWIQSIQKQTARLSALTNDLIYLSRMEEAKDHLQKIDFCISDLAEEMVLSFQALATTQDKELSASISPLLSYCGDEASIRQLVSILLDNAVKYAPSQSRIDVTLEKKGKNLKLTVCNESKPLSPEQLAHLFDRFYRTDASRNSETGGYGIGLSIARAVTDAHKGKISAESRDGHSLLITVIL